MTKHRVLSGLAAVTSRGLSGLAAVTTRRNLTHVLVQRSPHSLGWEVSVDALSGFHWAYWTGGANFFRGNERWLAAYMDCTLIPAESRGKWGHSCKTQPPPPHRIKVMIVKKKRYSLTYSDLADLADQA